MGSPDADVMQAAVVAQGDHAGGVDAVAADSMMGLGVGGIGSVAGRSSLRSGLVGGGGVVRPSERCGRRVLYSWRKRPSSQLQVRDG